MLLEAKSCPRVCHAVSDSVMPTGLVVLQTRSCYRFGCATDLIVPHIWLCYRFGHASDVVTKNVINFAWEKPKINKDISDAILSDMIYPIRT